MSLLAPEDHLQDRDATSPAPLLRFQISEAQFLKLYLRWLHVLASPVQVLIVFTSRQIPQPR